MLEMEGRGFLIGARESKQGWLTVQFPEKRQAGGSSGAAGAPEITDIVRWRLRGIAAAQTVRQNQGRVPGHVCDDKLFAARGRHDHVKTIDYLCHYELNHRKPPRIRLSAWLPWHRRETWAFRRQQGLRPFHVVSPERHRCIFCRTRRVRARLRDVSSVLRASFVLRESRAALPSRLPAGRRVFVRMRSSNTRRAIFANRDSRPN